MAPTKRTQAAQLLGRRGGKARAAKMTPEARSASARHAITARWMKAKALKAS